MVYSSHNFKIKAFPLADGFDFATVERYPSGSGAPPFDNLNIGREVEERATGRNQEGQFDRHLA